MTKWLECLGSCIKSGGCSFKSRSVCVVTILFSLCEVYMK